VAVEHGDPSTRFAEVQPSFESHVCDVHGLPSSHASVPVPWHFPLAHVSPMEHAFPSSQVTPSWSTSVHDEEPLQVRVAQTSLVHAMAVPAQVPPVHLSV
jgi:hypothetical protein